MLDKYSWEKYSLEKYSLEKYSLEKYSLEKYSLEKAFWKIQLTQKQFARSSFCSTPELWHFCPKDIKYS